jgi:glycosyltransferase involved in cell wall biosynthesis
MDPSNAVSSALSIGYHSPGWPLAAFGNGIVTAISTLAPALTEMGVQVTILASYVAQKISDPSVYDVHQTLASQSVARRAVDRLWCGLAPGLAHDHLHLRALIMTARRAVAERGVQILEMEESFGWARRVREATSIPVCIRLHGPWFLNGAVAGAPDDGEFRERVREEGRAIRGADAVTAPSRDVLERVRSFYGIALPEAEVIPAPTWPVPAEKRWHLEGCDPKEVLFIGRFDRHKGGDLIIEAFGRVLREVPDARLRFVGPDRDCLAEDGRRWNIKSFLHDRIPGALETGRVQWSGEKPLPFPVLGQFRRAAMVTVVCSRYENFPLTVVEAMAQGCPIVAAKTGGISEIIEDGGNGLLHQVGDHADIAAKIIQLLKNPALAAQLGQQAAADCQRRFYPDVVAGRLVDFYRRTISGQQTSPRRRGPARSSTDPRLA